MCSNYVKGVVFCYFDGLCHCFHAVLAEISILVIIYDYYYYFY